MTNEGKQAVPVAIVDQEQFNQLMTRLDKIDEKIEFYSGEKFLRAGKSIGRDLGTAYGLCVGICTVHVCRPLGEDDLNV